MVLCVYVLRSDQKRKLDLKAKINNIRDIILFLAIILNYSDLGAKERRLETEQKNIVDMDIISGYNFC